MKKFYITTPIYYPNARPHVGSAYTTIVCDAIARYKRMCGYEVAFLTGTDEHGEKLRRAAEEAGKSPAEFVAEKRQLFTNLWRTLGIPQHSDENPAGYRFVHTSQNEAHKNSVWWMIRKAIEYKVPYCPRCEAYLEHGTLPEKCAKCDGPVEFRSAIYKRKYEGRYCIFDERYVSDSTEPANCDICGRPAELISEENYFFRLSAFQDKLLKLYEEHPEFVQPEYRRNEVTSFVNGGLHDISISRQRLKWGVPWPDDPGQVVYVWYDALTSYLTGIGFRGGEKPEPDFEKYWLDPGAEVVHMIGKDIIRFHAVYWPAFLWAAGLRLPQTIFAHGWIYYEQDKMSKSKGNVVYADEGIADGRGLVAKDADLQPLVSLVGNDALRYYLLRDTPFGQDASFSYGGLIQRYNSDLANGLGNLASRVVTMLVQFCGGTVPAKPALSKNDPYWDIEGVYDQLRDWLREMNFFDALGVAALQSWLSRNDSVINDVEPWRLAKSASPADRQTLERTLYQRADFLRASCILLYPVMPQSAERLWMQLGCGSYLGRLTKQRVDQLEWGQLKPGAKIGKSEIIFPRLDVAKSIEKLLAIEIKSDPGRTDPRASAGSAQALRGDDGALAKQTAKKGTTVENQSDQKPAATATPDSRLSTPASTPLAPSPESRTPSPTVPLASEKISIEDFAKVEMRVGEIISAERIPKADKLLKLQVDIGTEVRQVLAGIAQYYEPEKLVGMKVVVVTNLQPRKMRGLESNGMIVAASVGEEGKPVLATFQEDVPKGSKLR
jgi:methionyl-tRNA synthetase